MARLTREQSQALTREKLLASASEMVARDGYSGASIERIAEEAGFSKGAFYSNFTNKEDIFLQLLERNAGGDVVELTERLR
ncbi:MAG: helix-turn-helix transcriptional regulator, partial [Mesorhizobium sp.]